MENLTPEQLEAILGTDYETVLADILRQKGSAEDRMNDPGRQLGQVGDGNVFVDPGAAIENVLNRRRAGKEAAGHQTALDKILEQQKNGRREMAGALSGQSPQAPMPNPTGTNPDGAEVMPDVTARPSIFRRIVNQY